MVSTSNTTPESASRSRFQRKAKEWKQQHSWKLRKYGSHTRGNGGWQIGIHADLVEKRVQRMRRGQGELERLVGMTPVSRDGFNSAKSIKNYFALMRVSFTESRPCACNGEEPQLPASDQPRARNSTGEETGGGEQCLNLMRKYALESSSFRSLACLPHFYTWQSSTTSNRYIARPVASER